MGGFDVSKPGGGMKQPKRSVAGRVAAFVRGDKKAMPKHPNAKTFTDGKGNLRQIGTGKILKPAPVKGVKGNEGSVPISKRDRGFGPR